MKIMLNGRSYSGKDVVADYISTNYNFNKISFAKPIYEIAERYFGMTKKDRPLLIAIGQKLRDIDPNVWVDWVLNNIDDCHNWIVSDVRQANEYELCEKEGFIPIRVISSLENRVERCEVRDGFKPNEKTIALWESIGEIGADNFEYCEIVNDGTLEDLYKQIDNFMLLHGISKANKN